MSEQNDLDAPFDEWGDTLPSRRPRVSEQVACPFCGHKRIGFRAMDKDDRYALRAYCNDCYTAGPPRYTEAAAIAAWNQRAGDAEQTLHPLPSPCLNCDIEHSECPNNCENYRLWDFGLQTLVKAQALDAELAKSQRDYAELSERVEQFRAEAEDVAEKREAELAALRQEKNEAIGAALKVEQKCYDQAQEIKALRETIAARERNLEFRANLLTEQRNELIKAEAELAPLRALREACEYVRETWQLDSDREVAEVPFGPACMLRDSLAACDEASAPTGK